MFSLARQVSSKAGASRMVARAMSSAVTAKDAVPPPSIRDKIVTLTFVDPSGARRKVPGLIGTTLWECADTHSIELGPISTGAPFEAKRSEEWTEPLFGEGPTCGFDHVLLTGNGVETCPPKNQTEVRMLNHYWDPDEIYPESRLASVIPLTKAMDGMVVFVPDRLVDDIP